MLQYVACFCITTLTLDLAFSIFSWAFLAAFPVLIIRDMRINGNISWPFYVASTLSFA